MQNRNERVRTSIKLCIAVFDEAETDDESERQGVPACRRWKRRDGKHAKSGGELHMCRFAAAAAFVTSRFHHHGYESTEGLDRPW